MSSVNHYYSDVNHTTTLWWQHYHHRQNDSVTPTPEESAAAWWMTQNDPLASSQIDWSSCTSDSHHHQLESLFEKSLTPSDVGKLNRLVIPKQHAEKHFPLNGSSPGGDTAAAEKGMLLSFEDEMGKCWRFRYSYWNSSQSYVLTKGWSRYVKEKQLDAGDVVFFQRHRIDTRRLIIGWRRRGDNGGFINTTPFSSTVATSTPYRQPHQLHESYYPHSAAVAGTSTAETQPPFTVAMGTSSRTVRLFGVNLECQLNGDVAAVEPPCYDEYGHYYPRHHVVHPYPW